MKNLIVFISFIISVLASGTRTMQAPAYSLTFTVKNFRSDKGLALGRLFNSETGFPKHPEYAFRKIVAPVNGKECILFFDHLTSGTYAFSCFQDENSNGKFDGNFYGSPLEGACSSNNAKGFLGPPRFSDAKVLVNGNVQQNLYIKYW